MMRNQVPQNVKNNSLVELMSILIITAFFSRAIGAAVLMSLAMLVTFILILAKAAEKG